MISGKIKPIVFPFRYTSSSSPLHHAQTHPRTAPSSQARQTLTQDQPVGVTLDILVLLRSALQQLCYRQSLDLMWQMALLHTLKVTMCNVANQLTSTCATKHQRCYVLYDITYRYGDDITYRYGDDGAVNPLVLEMGI